MDVPVTDKEDEHTSINIGNPNNSPMNIMEVLEIIMEKRKNN
jgi:hypothetical protein